MLKARTLIKTAGTERPPRHVVQKDRVDTSERGFRGPGGVPAKSGGASRSPLHQPGPKGPVASAAATAGYSAGIAWKSAQMRCGTPGN